MSINIRPSHARHDDIGPPEPIHWALAHLRTCASPALRQHLARHGCSVDIFRRLANATTDDYLRGFTLARFVSEGLILPRAASANSGLLDVMPDLDENGTVIEAPNATLDEGAEDAVAVHGPTTSNADSNPSDSSSDGSTNTTRTNQETMNNDPNEFDDFQQTHVDEHIAAAGIGNHVDEHAKATGFGGTDFEPAEEGFGQRLPTSGARQSSQSTDGSLMPSRPASVNTSSAAFAGGGGF